MPRVVVAMSGGVDSSVAAALTAEAGHEAIGVTLKLLAGPPTGFGCCGSPEDISDARRVCEKIGIKHYVLDFDDVFEKSVVDYFVAEYRNFRTPNPCVECNRKVKFGSLLKLAQAYGAVSVATGHYAQVERRGAAFALLRAADEEKDQTYFLHSLTQEELGKVMFPIGAMRKEEVRRKARDLGLKTADKEESQEICFIPGGDYRSFLRSKSEGSGDSEGEIRNSEGALLGRHSGLSNFTVGQRKGLGLSGSGPHYVTRIDGRSNTLFVGTHEETRASRFRVRRVSTTETALPQTALVRIRHRARLEPCSIEVVEDGVIVKVEGSVYSVAPGQSAVFYQGDRVLGGGVIDEILG